MTVFVLLLLAMVALIVVVGGIVLVVVVLSGRGRSAGNAEDLEALQGLARDMADMERRMDNLDTILRRDDR